MKLSSLRLFAFSIFFFFIALLSVDAALGQSVRTHVNIDSVSVGDIFQYSIVLQLDEEYNRITFPDTNSFPPSVELSERQQFKLTQFSDSLVYRLQFFGTDDIYIPELPVLLYSQEDTTIVYTSADTIYFKSVIEEGETDFRPLKPIFDFPYLWWPWILAAALVAGFLIWWFYFRKEPEVEETEPEPKVRPFYDPLKELEKSLISIKEDLKVEQTKEYKLFYSELSDAIRRYYEELYKVPALESTTRELLRYLDAYGADQEMVDATRRILLQADLVKFAKYIPTLDDSQKTYQLALRFLDRAKTADAARVSTLKSQYDARFKSNESKAEGV